MIQELKLVFYVNEKTEESFWSQIIDCKSHSSVLYLYAFFQDCFYKTILTGVIITNYGSHPYDLSDMEEIWVYTETALPHPLQPLRLILLYHSAEYSLWF